MGKNLNLKLCKALVDTDFFLLNLGYRYNLKKNINNNLIKSLNIFSVVKSIKQFIRVLQFMQRSESNGLVIQVSNQNIYYLVKEFFHKYTAGILIKIEQSSYSKDLSLSNKGTKMLLLLNFNESLNLTNIIQQEFLNCFTLFQNIDISEGSKNFVGNYKIYSDLLDFKKVIFIIVLANEILKKKKKSKNATY